MNKMQRSDEKVYISNGSNTTNIPNRVQKVSQSSKPKRKTEAKKKLREFNLEIRNKLITHLNGISEGDRSSKIYNLDGDEIKLYDLLKRLKDDEKGSLVEKMRSNARNLNGTWKRIEYKLN